MFHLFLTELKQQRYKSSPHSAIIKLVSIQNSVLVQFPQEAKIRQCFLPFVMSPPQYSHEEKPRGKRTPGHAATDDALHGERPAAGEGRGEGANERLSKLTLAQHVSFFHFASILVSSRIHVYIFLSFM